MAPAGSPEALHAAVAAGADAVYLSGKRFGARRYAPNFDREEMAGIISYCHERDISVYVTINTLIADSEMEDAIGDALHLYRCGVDAIIIQDIGLFALLHRFVPGLALHASTQMTVHSVEGIRAVYVLGARRVVLAREMTLPEITTAGEVARELGVGLEVFVHGALCYSYSGQCLLSSLIGGRSGNRGACAQPCRKPYELVFWSEDAFGRPERMRRAGRGPSYLLSPRDLCTYPRIEEIAAAPVDALKIEGRMRSPEYVSAVVSVYRRALDAAAAGRFAPSKDAMRLLLEAFNREFTGGYLLDARKGTVMGTDFAANRGLLVGHVEKMGPSAKTAVVRLTGMHTPAAGDGMVITAMPDRSDAVGVVLRRDPEVKGGMVELPVHQRVQAGAAVYLTSGKEIAALHQQILHEPLRAPLPLSLHLKFAGATPVLSGKVRTRRGEVSYELASAIPMEPARTQPVPEEKLRELIGRTGDVPYRIEDFAIDYPGGLFSPIGVINAFRRSFFEGLGHTIAAQYLPDPEEADAAERRIEDYLRRRTIAPPPPFGEAPAVSVWAATLEGVRAAVDGGCTRVCFEPSCARNGDAGGADTPAAGSERMAASLTAAAQVCRDAGVSLVWKWPRITRGPWLGMAVSLLPVVRRLLDGVMVEGLGAMQAARDADPGLPLYGAPGINIFNAEAAGALAPDVAALTLSPEMTLAQVRECAGIAAARRPASACRLEYVVHGPAELAVAEDCVFATATSCPGKTNCGRDGTVAGIRDPKGHIFPVTTDDECRTHIWNSRETCLIDSLPELREAGVAGFVLDCRIKPPAYTRTVTAAYAEGVKMVGGAGAGAEPASGVRSWLGKKKEDMKKIATGGLTTAHLYRGVLEESQ